VQPVAATAFARPWPRRPRTARAADVATPRAEDRGSTVCRTLAERWRSAAAGPHLAGLIERFKPCCSRRSRSGTRAAGRVRSTA
jgi:hypothetical protein